MLRKRVEEEASSLTRFKTELMQLPRVSGQELLKEEEILINTQEPPIRVDKSVEADPTSEVHVNFSSRIHKLKAMEDDVNEWKRWLQKLKSSPMRSSLRSPGVNTMEWTLKKQKFLSEQSRFATSCQESRQFLERLERA